MTHPTQTHTQAGHIAKDLAGMMRMTLEFAGYRVNRRGAMVEVQARRAATLSPVDAFDDAYRALERRWGRDLRPQGRGLTITRRHGGFTILVAMTEEEAERQLNGLPL